MERLNPKLTKRGQFPALSSSISDVSQTPRSLSDDEGESGDEESDEEDDVVSSSIVEIPKKQNPRRHLLHNGTWVPKAWELGRHVPRTGIWDCCGASDHLSMYCDSIKARELYKKGIDREDSRKRREVATTNRRKKEILEHIENAKKSNPEAVELKLTPEEVAIKEACSQDNTFNAPMLVAWMLKHYEDETISSEGLGFLLKHLETGEGCFLLHRQGVLTPVFKIQFYFKENPNVQILVLKVFAKFLDCNYTRGLILKDAELLRVVFSVCYYYMNSRSHVDLCLYCMMQCTRSEVNRTAMLGANMVAYAVTFIKRYPLVPTILRSIIKLFNWISTTQERMDFLVRLKAVNIVIQCLKKHSTNRDILAPGILFLSRAAMSVPVAFEAILKKKAIPVIIYSLKIVYDDEVIQLEGLKLLQILSRTSEGWKQISEVKGGWQSITAGTSLGDDLIHEVPGSFNNPGWCIGETPFLPLLDRLKISAAKHSISSLAAEPKAAWTSFSLTEYMGLSLKAKTLAINTEFQDIQFDLISTLDLLPKPTEEKEAWFMRVKEFEKENGVKLDDMIATVQELRRREVITKNREAGIVDKAAAAHEQAAGERFANEISNEVVAKAKEVYVMGNLITGGGLAEADMSIEEMQGIGIV